MYWAAHARLPRNRAFNYAVLASLVFHGALLFSFTFRPKSPPALPGPLVAHLVTARASAPLAAPAPAPERPPVEQAAPPPPPPPPQARPVPQPRPASAAKPHAPASKPAPVAPPAEPATPPPPAVASPPASSAPQASAPAIAKTAPAPAAAAPAEDAGSLDAYRIDLMRMARRYKRYPRVAMDNNWEGKVIVRMVIGANGLISSLSVVTSSGHEILDKQAVEMIQKSKPLVLIPAALRGREFRLEIPVIYSLKAPDAG